MKTEETPTIRIVLADDHALVRSAIGALLSSIAGVQLLAEAQDGEQLLAVLSTVQPDIVLTDLYMPGMDGYTAASRIRSAYPAVRVIALSADHTVEAVKRAVANGVCGFLRKDAPRLELERALRDVMHSGSYFGNGIAQLLLQPTLPRPEELLTERQFEVFIGLAKGKSSKELAYEMGLSPKTVDVHRARTMERLGIHDIAGLTRLAVRMGLLR